MSPDQSHVENVFETSTENGKVNVVVSKNGHTETHKNGDRFVVLENGRRYDGEPGQPDFRIMEYERYGVKIQSQRSSIRRRQPACRRWPWCAIRPKTTSPNSRGAPVCR